MGIELHSVVATEIGLIIKIKQQGQRTNRKCWPKSDQNRNIFYNLIIRSEIPRMQVKKFCEIHGKYELIETGEGASDRASGRVRIKVELIGNSKASNKSTRASFQEFFMLFKSLIGLLMQLW